MKTPAKLLLLSIMTAAAISCTGGNQFTPTGNPLITDKFTADPAPMVHDGRLYLYVGHDEFYEGQDTASGGKEFNIRPRLSAPSYGFQVGSGRGMGIAGS